MSTSPTTYTWTLVADPEVDDTTLYLRLRARGDGVNCDQRIWLPWNDEGRAVAGLVLAGEEFYAELEDAAQEMDALAEDSCGSSTEEHFRAKAARYRRILAEAQGQREHQP